MKVDFLLRNLFFSIRSCSSLVLIDSDDDCWTNDRSYSMEKSYATSVKFSSQVAYGQANCSVELANPWLIDNQYGLSVFFPRSMDCGSTVTVHCLTENLRSNEVNHRSTVDRDFTEFHFRRFLFLNDLLVKTPKNSSSFLAVQYD